MSAPPSDNDTLRIAFRSIHKLEDGGENVLTVFCPRHGEVVSLSECRKCEWCHGLSVDPTDRDSFLRCSFQGAAAPAPGPRDLGAQTSAQDMDARNTAVAEIMTTPVRCATPELTIESLTSLLLEQAISAVPVVDGSGKAIGIVSKTDLLRRYYDDADASDVVNARITDATEATLELGPGFHMEQLTRGTVADVMTGLVYTVSMETSIARVSALMAYEGVHRIVVTAQGGVAVGIVSSLDILRWLARRDGFIVPDRTRQQVGD